MRTLLLSLCLALGLATSAAAQKKIAFAEHVITTGLRGGYQVVVADLNHDGKPDLIALSSGMTDLVWYENPGWQEHIIASNLPRLINCAAEDLDGDGIPELVVAWAFANEASNSIGKVGVLKHNGDPRKPWTLQEIDELPTSHRLRWADLEGNGHKVAVNAPLTAEDAKGPEYKGSTPLVFYRPGEWKRQVLNSENQGVQHGIFVTRWQPYDTRDSLLTASFSGIDLLRWVGGIWTRTEISKGDPSACPKCGSSDVAIGHLSGKASKQRFLGAIEPWHGNQVAIYSENGTKWDRTVIDESLTDGHTILAADFDGDGNDEVVAGFRQGIKAVYLYRWNGKNWAKQSVDNAGFGAASCAAADLNGDGAVDIACIASSTLKWYQNVPSSAK